MMTPGECALIGLGCIFVGNALAWLNCKYQWWNEKDWKDKP